MTSYGSDAEYLIRAPLAENASITEVAERIEGLLADEFGPGSFEVRSTELVDAKVGGELQTKALLAIVFSMVLTLTYLAMRFELRFGLAAVIATLHDILITLGALAVSAYLAWLKCPQRSCRCLQSRSGIQMKVRTLGSQYP